MDSREAMPPKSAKKKGNLASVEVIVGIFEGNYKLPCYIV